MPRLVLAAFVWLVTALPCYAATNLELGTFPNVSVHFEGNRASIGLGLSANYSEQSIPSFLGTEQVHVWVLTPSAIARLFLNDDATRSLLELRVSREVSSVTGSSFLFVPDLDEFYDDWSASLGAGLRAGINERFHVGGAVAASVEFETFSSGDDTIRAGTTFRVFLDYALSH